MEKLQIELQRLTLAQVRKLQKQSRKYLTVNISNYCRLVIIPRFIDQTLGLGFSARLDITLTEKLLANAALLDELKRFIRKLFLAVNLFTANKKNCFTKLPEDSALIEVSFRCSLVPVEHALLIQEFIAKQGHGSGRVACISGANTEEVEDSGKIGRLDVRIYNESQKAFSSTIARAQTTRSCFNRILDILLP
jgi:hypothetical protein